MREITCVYCESTMPETEFYNNRTKKNGKNEFCIECWRTYLFKEPIVESIDDVIEPDTLEFLKSIHRVKMGEIKVDNLTSEEKEFLSKLNKETQESI